MIGGEAPAAWAFTEPGTGSDRAGYRAGEAFDVLGYGGGEAAPLYLDDVVVPASAAVGEAGRGLEVMLAGEAQAKVRAAAINLGVVQRAVEEAGRSALQRLHREVPIADKFSTIRALLGEMEAEVLAGRALPRSVAEPIDNGQGDIAKHAAAARIIPGRGVRSVTSNAMQICGAYGWTEELPVERLHREAKFFEVTQGVSEIQKAIAGRFVLDEIKGGR